MLLKKLINWIIKKLGLIAIIIKNDKVDSIGSKFIKKPSKIQLFQALVLKTFKANYNEVVKNSYKSRTNKIDKIVVKFKKYQKIIKLKNL